jgi:hypothetical protein
MQSHASNTYSSIIFNAWSVQPPTPAVPMMFLHLPGNVVLAVNVSVARGVGHQVGFLDGDVTISCDRRTLGS